MQSVERLGVSRGLVSRYSKFGLSTQSMAHKLHAVPEEELTSGPQASGPGATHPITQAAAAAAATMSTLGYFYLLQLLLLLSLLLGAGWHD